MRVSVTARGTPQALLENVRALLFVTPGTDPFKGVFRAALPLLGVVGGFNLLIATLSTAGIFVRLRTASLDLYRTISG